ncbi:MAG: ABC transporter substrate-binding protein [Spirochaetota bacterium]|nr:ABC transporter substrate-binding protein [Spirochaetota bacterium]
MKNLRRLLFLFSVCSFLLIITISFFYGCKGKREKLKIIKLPCIVDISGPYAPITAPAYSGFLDACEYVNEQGGIEGVPVEAVVRDCSGKVDTAISYYTDFREMEPKPLAIFISVSAEGAALRERIVEDDMIAMCVPGTPALYPPSNTFGLYPMYQDMFGGFLDWLVDTWDWKKKGRNPRLAIMTWDTTYGRSIFTDEVDAYAKKKKVDIVAKEVFGVRDMDVSTQLVRVREKKPDWIFTNVAVTGAAAIAKSAKDLKYKIKLASNTTFDWSALMIGGKIMDGSVICFSYASWDDLKNPGTKLLTKWFKEKKRRPQERTLVYHLAWAHVLTMREVISKVVNKAGWENLDGKAIKEQMMKLKDFSPGNGITYFSFDDTRRSPSKGYIARVINGKIIPITDWRELPDLRNPKFK